MYMHCLLVSTMSLRAGRAVLGMHYIYVHTPGKFFATAQPGCPHARAGERCKLRSKLFEARIFPVVDPASGMCASCRQVYQSSIAAGWIFVGGTVLLYIAVLIVAPK